MIFFYTVFPVLRPRPDEARLHELEQVCAVTAKGRAQLCRRASPALHRHRQGGENLSIAGLEVLPGELPGRSYQPAVSHVVQVCRNLPGGGRRLRPEVVCRGLHSSLQLFNFLTPVNNDLIRKPALRKCSI